MTKDSVEESKPIEASRMASLFHFASSTRSDPDTPTSVSENVRQKIPCIKRTLFTTCGASNVKISSAGYERVSQYTL